MRNLPTASPQLRAVGPLLDKSNLRAEIDLRRRPLTSGASHTIPRKPFEVGLSQERYGEGTDVAPLNRSEGTERVGVAREIRHASDLRTSTCYLKVHAGATPHKLLLAPSELHSGSCKTTLSVFAQLSAPVATNAGDCDCWPLPQLFFFVVILYFLSRCQCRVRTGAGSCALLEALEVIFFHD